MKLHTPDYIEAITPYPPGKPIEELEREYRVKNPIKLASNENAWGPSPQAVAAIEQGLANLHRYPDGSSYYLVKALAEHFSLEAEEVVLGNGSNEVIEFLVKAYVTPGDEVITSHPSFLMYQKFVQVRGGVNQVVPLKDLHHDLPGILARVTARTRLIFLDNPNNPTGTALSTTHLDEFLAALPEDVIVVLDEAYVDFMADHLRPDLHTLIRGVDKRCAVVSLRTFSKAYGLSGLRVGFGLMHRAVAESLHKVRQPFNMNSLAQIGAEAALRDQEYYEQTVQRTREGIGYLQREVEKLGCTSYDSHTNFFLVDVGGDATQLYTAMLHQGVIIRAMAAYGFPSCIRITVGTHEENQRLLGALAHCLRELGYV